MHEEPPVAIDVLAPPATSPVSIHAPVSAHARASLRPRNEGQRFFGFFGAALAFAFFAGSGRTSSVAVALWL